MNTRLILMCFLMPCCAYAQQSKILPFAYRESISDSQGKPKDSTTFYFPLIVFTDTFHGINYFDPESKFRFSSRVCDDINTEKDEISKAKHIPLSDLTDTTEVHIDSFLLQWFSLELLKMDEPVLFNYPLNKEVYRFTWLRSFHRPVVIKIERENDNFYVTTKMLERDVEDPYYMVHDHKTELITPDNNIPFEVNRRVNLPQGDYVQLMSLVNSMDLYNMPYAPYTPCSIGNDGAEWIFEVQNKNGYYCVHRWSPRKNTSLRLLGELMIRLGNLTKERIY